MHVHSYEQVLMVYEGYRLHKNLLFYVPPILLTIGTLGNVLSVVILTRKPMRKYSTYFYLAVLSAADTFVLYVGLLRMWVGEITGHDVRDKNTWACKLISIFGYTVSDFSGWLIVAVTAERYVAVCYPLQATNFCNRARAIKVVLGLLLVLLGINAHFLWTVGLNYVEYEGKNITYCSGVEKYRKLIDEALPWIDAFIYSFIPFVVILILNTFIIRQVVKARRQRRQMRFADRGGHFSQQEQSRSNGSAAGDGSKITPMLLTISVSFLITTLPVNITNITHMFLSKRVENNNLESLISYRLAKTVTELLMYLNHSINFFLYCATGQKFRQQLLKSLPKRRTGHGWTKPTPGSDYSLCLLTQNNHRKSAGESSLLSPNVVLWPKHSSNSLTVTLQVSKLKKTPETVPLRHTT